MQNCININVIIENKMLTYFYENYDTLKMAQITTNELKLLTGSVITSTNFFIIICRFFP